MNEPGPQFKRLFRGLHGANQQDYDAFIYCNKGHEEHEHTVDCLGASSSSTVNMDKIGRHWTDNKDVAENFAGNRGTVLEAYVNKRHIIKPGTAEYESATIKHNIAGYDEPVGPFKKPENEITLRENSPVHIFKVHSIRSNPNDNRLEEFKAPLGGLT